MSDLILLLTLWFVVMVGIIMDYKYKNKITEIREQHVFYKNDIYSN